MRSRRRLYNLLLNRWLLGLGLLLSLLLVGLASSADPRVWPVRNTLSYHLHMLLWEMTAPPTPPGQGSLSGTVSGAGGEPLAGATVLLATWQGETFLARSDRQGRYTLSEVPAGKYRPIAGAPGHADHLLGGLWGGIEVGQGLETVVQVKLDAQERRTVSPPGAVRLGGETTLRCRTPLERSARRRTLALEGETAADTLYYLPAGAGDAAVFPTLLAVYPGPVETWECVSIPLAAAGYAVLAVGPAYSLELEEDVDRLERLLALARQGALPGADGTRVGVLGGSYSAILTQRLLQRDPNIGVSVLLGPPTDLFDARRRWQAGTFVPPFPALEQALIALGFPDRDPLRYWQYSSRFHVTRTLPPTILFHSYQDDIVPYQQSEVLAAELERVGVPHELHLFEGSTHYLLDEGEQATAIYDLTLEFLARHLR